VSWISRGWAAVVVCRNPTASSSCKNRSGRLYLDVRWLALGLVVEIDGSGQREGLAQLDDNFRQKAVTSAEDVVLR
jgi:hypothetical protein